MFFEFFVLFGMWWWILFALFIMADIFFLEHDNGFGATSIVIAFLVTIFFFGDWNPFPLMMADPLLAVELVLGYFIFGAVWAVVKWYFHGLNERDEYRVIKQRFFSNEGIAGDKIPQDLISKWENLVERRFSKGVPPDWMQSKATMTMWMSHWPFSLVWTVLNDPIRRIFMFIYSRLGGIMQWITDRQFKNELVEYDDD